MREQMADAEIPLSDAEFEILWGGMSHSNEQQTSLSTAGEHRLTPPGTGHMFLYDDPYFTLEQTRDLMRQIRERDAARQVGTEN